VSLTLRGQPGRRSVIPNDSNECCQYRRWIGFSVQTAQLDLSQMLTDQWTVHHTRQPQAGCRGDGDTSTETTRDQCDRGQYIFNILLQVIKNKKEEDILKEITPKNSKYHFIF